MSLDKLDMPSWKAVSEVNHVHLPSISDGRSAEVLEEAEGVAWQEEEGVAIQVSLTSVLALLSLCHTEDNLNHFLCALSFNRIFSNITGFGFMKFEQFQF